MNRTSSYHLASRVLRWSLASLALLTVVIVPFALGGEALELWSAEIVRGSSAFVAVASLFLLAADVVLPIPSSVVLTTLGTVLGVFWGGLVGTCGMTLGCWLALLLGRRLGEPAAQRLLGSNDFALLTSLFNSYGFVALAACRAVPILAEASVIAAGAVRLPLKETLLVLGLANAGVSTTFALLGASASDLAGLLVAAVGSVLIPGLALAGAGIIRRAIVPAETNYQEKQPGHQMRLEIKSWPRSNSLFR